MVITKETEETEIRHLLNNAQIIYEHFDELRKLSGEGFNIFSVLQIESSEVVTHSRFLTELLNPNGSHGIGDTFLKLFVDQLDIPDFNTKTATAKSEISIGEKTDETGGRIDIVISNQSGRKIVIENKIYAVDQPNQLLRYRNQYPDATLLYLTLNGKKPSDYSKGKGEGKLSDEAYKCISYRNDILNWLENCRKESANFPLLRETITQYIILIKKLTNQNLSSKMNEQIIDLVISNNGKSFLPYFSLVDTKDAILDKVLEILKVNIEEYARTSSDNLKLKWDLSRARKNTKFIFSNETMDAHNISICFEFEEVNARGLIFGFIYVDKTKPKQIPAKLIENFNSMFTECCRPTELWPCHAYWNEWRFWDRYKYKEVLTGAFMVALKEKLEKLLKVCEAKTAL